MAVTIIQVLAFGLALGGIYALFASGLTLIYSVTKQFHVAHGDFLVGALFACYSLHVAYRLDPYVSMFILAPVYFGIGFLVFRFLFRPLMLAGGSGVFVGFLGVSWLVESILYTVYGSDTVSTSTLVGGKSISVGAVVLPVPYIVATAVSLIVTFVLHRVLTRTEFGRSVRAIAENEEMAALMGIDARKVQALVFSAAFVLIAVAAALIAPVWSVDAFRGMGLLLFAFVVCTLGGLGNFVGALAAAFLIGAMQAFGDYYLGAALAPVFPYAAFVAVLLLRPEGLFARK